MPANRGTSGSVGADGGEYFYHDDLARPLQGTILPQVARASEIFHGGGKVVIAHMCGLLRALLPFFRETGMDGVHSLTPPPVGDTTFEMAWETMGDSFRVEGRLGTTCWMGKSVREIRNYLRPLISAERIRKSPFLLEIHTDGYMCFARR